MNLYDFFNEGQEIKEGVMKDIHIELSDIVANEDFDALYELFTANTPAGRFVQDMYNDVVIDTGLHPDDDFERIEQIVFDRLADDFGQEGMSENSLNELAPDQGSGDAGNYFRELASAWYNGAYDSGSLPKGIKTQEDVERLLQRGVVAPDGKTRKYNIDYNSDFDGVVIFSDDYYKHGDHDDTIDSRTGQKWGPYDFMAFSDEDLSEGINEFAADDGDDGDGGSEDDALRNYAKMWWTGDEATQMQIEKVLARMGWEIGEDEGGYDNGGVFVVRAGDVNGRSYQSWPHEELVIDENRVLGFLSPGKPPVRKNTSLADMRREFEKETNTPLPNIEHDKDADEKKAQVVHRRPAEEGVAEDLSRRGFLGAAGAMAAGAAGVGIGLGAASAFDEPIKIDGHFYRKLQSFAVTPERLQTAQLKNTPEGEVYTWVIQDRRHPGSFYYYYFPKEQDVKEETCPHCNGPMFSEMLMMEKKDACYYKVKSRYKVWPSAYASGALVKCRKKGAANWGNANESITQEEYDQLDENLKKWFSDKWVRFGPDGKIRGDCARGDSSEGKPKCLPQSKAYALGKKGRASAAARKRRQDPNAERSGPAKNVATKEAANPAQQAAIAINMKKHHKKPKGVAEDSTAHDCKHCNGKGYHTVTKKDGTKVATNCPQCKGKGYIVTKGVAEGLPQTLRKVVPGYAKREIDKKMDAGKFGKTDADKDANFQRYKKIQDKIKEQGVAEAAACAMTEEGTMCPVHGLEECGSAMVYEAVGGIELAEILLKGFEEKYPDLVKQIDRKELENTVMDAVELADDVDSMSDVDMMIDDIAMEFDSRAVSDQEPTQEPIKEHKLYYNVIGTPVNQLRSDFGFRKDHRGWYLNENVSIKRLMTAFRAFGEPTRL